VARTPEVLGGHRAVVAAVRRGARCHDAPVARLPYVDPEQAPEPVREAFERLPPLNIFRLLAHAKTCFRPFLRLGEAILTRQELDPRFRELAILRVARLTPAEYEWVQHVAIARAVGVTDAQIEALERGDAEAFSGDERLVVRFTDQVVRDAKPDDATFAAVSERLSPREIVELTLTVGYYMAIARVMEVAQVDVDEPLADSLVR
jgi:4-carboxymuconolactone decarboxylase